MTSENCAPAIAPVRIVAGRYRLLRAIGSGAMGSVFEAEDIDNGLRVAVKIVRREHEHDAEIVARFVRESRLVARITHPNVGAVLETGRCAIDGSYYLVQEFLAGGTLRDEFVRSTTLSPREAHALLTPVMEGAAAAHAIGVVHRDIKPENIVVVRGVSRTRPVLVDFGLAKCFNDREDRLTQSGVALGTPLYMSPEQARGARIVDGQADIWAMGVIWFEALTGRPLFRGRTNLAILCDLLLAPIPRVESLAPHVPSMLANAVQRAIERHRKERYGSMREFVDAIEASIAP